MLKSKITANIEKGERILVHVDFFDGKEKVHEITTAFPLETPEKEIRKEVEKAGALFEQEKVQGKEQKKVDEVFEKAKDTINKLNK